MHIIIIIFMELDFIICKWAYDCKTYLGMCTSLVHWYKVYTNLGDSLMVHWYKVYTNLGDNGTCCILNT
jgi:hypothetical protein